MSSQNQSVINASADGVDRAGSSSNASSSGPSMQQLRGSRASMSAPTKKPVFNPHAQNPGRIPTAGGVAVGSRQYEARRASMAPQSPPLPEEGKAESSKSGAANGAANGAAGGPVAPYPAGKEEKPMFNMPDYGNGNGKAPEKDAAAGAAAPFDPGNTAAQAGQEAPAQEPSTTEGAQEGVKSAEDKGMVEKATDAVKENMPAAVVGGGETSQTTPGSPSKERRASRFDMFKEKLGMGGGKK